MPGVTRLLKRSRRWTAVLLAALYVLQGAFLLPLHERLEAEPHPACEACAPHCRLDASAPSLRPLPQHNHPVHDENDCALCASAHRVAEPAAQAPADLHIEAVSVRPCWPATLSPCAGGFLLPDSRGPPVRPS